MNKIKTFIFISLLIIACQPNSKVTVEDLFEVDKQFSETAEEIGFNKAFIEFAHDDAVLLRKDNMPLIGKAAITQLFEKANSEGVQFTWEPISGKIALSGEFSSLLCASLENFSRKSS